MTREERREQQREAFLDGAVQHVLRDGVTTLSLRPLAAELGTSDRMLLYYFGSRERLITEVLDRVTAQLRAALEQALPAGPLSPAALLDAVWGLLCSPEAEPPLRLYVELSGLTARDRAPFADATRSLARVWLDWVSDRLDIPAGEREAAVLGVLAVVDGVLLVRFVLGAEAAEQAVAGVRALRAPT